MPSEHEQNSQVNGSLIPKWNNERRTEAISETKDAKGGEYCLATQHGGQQERQSIRQKREEALQRPELERFSKRQCGSHKMRRTIRYLGSVKKKLFTFYVLCFKIRRRRVDIQITTLLEGLCLCMFFFGVFYPFLPMLSVGKSMFNTWSSSKNIFSSLFSPCDFGSAVFFYLSPLFVFDPILEQNDF